MFLSLCAAYGFGKPIYDLHRSNAVLRYQQAMEVREQVWGDLFLRLNWARREDPRVVEEVLGLPRRYFPPVPMKGEASFDIEGGLIGPPRGRHVDALSQAGVVPRPKGWRVEVKFRDGRVVSGRATPPPRPPEPWVWNTVNFLGRLALFAAPMVWLGGLLAGVVERTRGTRFGEVALAAAILGTVAWSVRPDRVETTAGWAGLAGGGAMMLAALLMIRRLRRIARSRRRHVCFGCGYDLTGNTSGICPECGLATYDGFLRRKAEQAEAVAHAVAEAEIDEPGGEGDADADEVIDHGAGSPAEFEPVRVNPPLEGTPPERGKRTD
jgi:hypothetical protein